MAKAVVSVTLTETVDLEEWSMEEETALDSLRAAVEQDPLSWASSADTCHVEVELVLS